MLYAWSRVTDPMGYVKPKHNSYHVVALYVITSTTESVRVLSALGRQVNFNNRVSVRFCSNCAIMPLPAASDS